MNTEINTAFHLRFPLTRDRRSTHFFGSSSCRLVEGVERESAKMRRWKTRMETRDVHLCTSRGGRSVLSGLD